MVRHNYDAMVCGDGACAGCGEKSVLRAISAVTEAHEAALPRESRPGCKRKQTNSTRQELRSWLRSKREKLEEYDLLGKPWLI